MEWSSLPCARSRVPDLAKSLSSIHGVRDLASEYFLGHKPSSYEKSAKYNEGWYRRQYQKVESYLNILTNPPGSVGGLDEARKAAARSSSGCACQGWAILKSRWTS